MNKSELKSLIKESIREVLKENSLAGRLRENIKPGATIDDWELVNKNIIKPEHQDDWLELFSDEGDINFQSPRSVMKFTQLANMWLKNHGYAWRVARAISQNDEGEITWKIA